MPTYDVIVVGGGIVGASTAYHLAVMGAKTLLMERDRFGFSNATGKSGGLVRIYDLDPKRSLLAHKSFRYFTEWADLIGGTCGFTACGLLVLIGPDGHEDMRKRVRVLKLMGVSVEALDPAQIGALQPFLSLEGVAAAAFEPMGGFADPLLATRGFASKARELGAVLMEGTACRDFIVHRDRVAGVVTDCGTIDSERVILCNGAWATSLLDRFGFSVPVTVQRIAVHFLQFAAPLPRRMMAHSDRVFHAFYRMDHAHLLLAGTTLGQQQVEPDTEGTADAHEAAEIMATVRRRFPSLSSAVYSGQRVGIDSYTPDRRIILDWLPNVEGVLLVSGLSGGGFKSAPAIGRLAAEMVLGAPPGIDCSGFRLSRFASGSASNDFDSAL